MRPQVPVHTREQCDGQLALRHVRIQPEQHGGGEVRRVPDDRERPPRRHLAVGAEPGTLRLGLGLGLGSLAEGNQLGHPVEVGNADRPGGLHPRRERHRLAGPCEPRRGRLKVIERAVGERSQPAVQPRERHERLGDIREPVEPVTATRSGHAFGEELRLARGERAVHHSERHAHAHDSPCRSLLAHVHLLCRPYPRFTGVRSRRGPPDDQVRAQR